MEINKKMDIEYKLNCINSHLYKKSLYGNRKVFNKILLNISNTGNKIILKLLNI
jgi:hypothetical protein